MTDRNRYEYSLLELCGRIHGSVTGSGDGIPREEAWRIFDWLKWRVGAGWEATCWPGAIAFDVAVRSLALAAVAELARALCDVP